MNGWLGRGHVRAPELCAAAGWRRLCRVIASGRSGPRIARSSDIGRAGGRKRKPNAAWQDAAQSNDLGMVTSPRPAALQSPIALYTVGLFSMGYVDFYI